MSAAMASSAMVVREHGQLLKGKKGYDDFDPAAFAGRLLDNAEKLLVFAHANPGPRYAKGMSDAAKAEVNRRRNLALRSDGQVVEIGYRATAADKIVAAASWLARARLANDPAASAKWYALADTVYEADYKLENHNDWYRDYGAGDFAKLAAYNLMVLRPAEEKFHHELQYYCSSFVTYKQTPGGLRLREWSSHQYGSLRHANNAAAIALFYSRHVEKSPPLVGNTWWKGSKTNAQLRDEYFAAAKSQVDYALGSNPYGRSYLVGFGDRPFNHPHHRGAYGAWAGFLHLIPGKPEYRPEACRHVLYGALIAGPDNQDVFTNARPGNDYAFRDPADPKREVRVPREGYVFNHAHEPIQLVENSVLNEVALDYNAGITASFALLTATGHGTGQALPDDQFPPKDVRNNSTDLHATDREFFVIASEAKSGPGATEVEATVYNRSRWPAHVTDQLSFRYYFTLDGTDGAGDATATLVGGDKSAKVGPVTPHAGKVCFVEVSFPGERVFPGDRDKRTDLRTVRLRLAAPAWDGGNDPSRAGMTDQPKLLPAIPVYNAGVRVGGEEP
jgi:hypothetical protein